MNETTQETTALTTIATPATTALAKGGLGLTGRMFQLKPANLELVQNSTKQKKPTEVGKFRIPETGELFEELHVVLLAPPADKRVMFPNGELGVEPLCRSNDGLVPADNALQPQAARCGYYDERGYFQPTCPKASWKAWQKNKCKENIPPCKEKVQLLFVERTTKLPFILQLGGKSIAPIRSAMQHVARLAEVLVAQRDAVIAENALGGAQKEVPAMPNIFDFSMKIRPVEVDGRQGSYYVVGFSEIGTIKAEDREKFGQLYIQFANRNTAEEAAAAEAAVSAAFSEQDNGPQAPVEA